MPHGKEVFHAGNANLGQLHESRWQWLEQVAGPAVALPTEYPDGYRVPQHRHSRSQLLHALVGVVLVTTRYGRWMVPPDHAMWIPAGTEHSVEMLGDVSMRSVYVMPQAIPGLPEGLRVVGVTDLMHSLIVESEKLPQGGVLEGRGGLIMNLLLHEIPTLPERPLGLPFPSDPRLSALCRRFVAAPSPHATIDEWADAAGMSRRSFTRAFQRQTGLPLSTWRQQACLFAALPRLADGEPITRVALDLGYDSVPAFITMFKRMLGTSPRGYMRGARENVEVARRLIGPVRLESSAP
ncbi:AraC family transcriptional regulator [Mesorhizobium sp. M7A.F.Ca.CA.001.09.2.1]|uniref:Helix-turn-helix transcriptional regulator n=1 Tax=Mesorhizobium ciceri TaxID=39645 RepID=A0AB38THD5_9HYPH|nr:MULTISPECIES: helix-turn-helix transcriptional regulator [Mesorhizobium]RUY55385.1 AraC family transcriptional regulator [Mesorhizobium sp. M7A.F.Ca.CA.001.13.2.1]RUZ73869.1 AraC family transcriptional regulator [Mesorhizobium sp. M7A.F.Ca.US.003.02.2.1]MDF3218477.1 helix-turn-helix transcriptional regulator [Mesorhizobium ciceri]RUY69599.1 AraC family transcriptional regulator [Mesorhizobium sp. M7A.F.Ca.CA.001.13.1.1]RUY70558.1 AraC family transcriptional regulator [Mesorhizobium sp. M7A.